MRLKDHGPCFFCKVVVIEGTEGVSWLKRKRDKEKCFFHDACMTDYVRSLKHEQKQKLHINY